MKIIKITGCGISAIGVAGSQELLWIASRIIEKGGRPVATVIKEEAI